MMGSTTGVSDIGLSALNHPSSAIPSRISHIASVDLMRGLVIVLMALDHVRWYFLGADFSPTDLSHTDSALFLTRWVTHLCAPTFVFLAGTSAFLSAAHSPDRHQLAARLFTRGLWLVILELTIVRFAWFFNLDYSQMDLQVIWALGWSMVVLAGLVHMPMWSIAVLGIGMIAGHNLLDDIRLEDFEMADGSLGWQGWVLSVLHIPRFPVVYPLIPWIGVMAAGYAFGPLMLMTSNTRKQLTLVSGVAVIAAFVILRAYNTYGDPSSWSTQKTTLFTLFSFLNTTKYPPSLLFLLMTLSAMFILLSVFERQHGLFGNFFITFGRVPLFFYVLHLYVIHGLVIVFGYAISGDIGSFMTIPVFFPPWWGFSLPIVYLICVAITALLYPVCRWFAAIKSRHKGRWWTYYV
ncbi:MAG: heparan-alpha-glucosaminide N-acetyltransferase domain-containing protein [Nitrosospira sp.]